MGKSMIINERTELNKRILDGASWFYWIAGLSIINSLVLYFGGDINFIVGLGITQLVDAFGYVIAENIGSSLPIIIGFIIDAIVIIIFFIFGFYSRKKKNWAFIAGMILYLLDGAIFVWAKDFLSVGFHVFALFMIYAGFNSNLKLKKLPEELETNEDDLNSETLEEDNGEELQEELKYYQDKEYTVSTSMIFKIIGWFALIFFGTIAVLAALDSEIYPALIFVIFALLGVLILIFSGKITINNKGFKVKVPLGTFFISWDELENVETRSGNMILLGCDKKLSVFEPRNWTGNERTDALGMFYAKIMEKNIQIKDTARAFLPGFKNSKVDE